MDLNQEKLAKTQDSVSNSFSYDGYEKLHDEDMDQISVSVHYSDYEGAFDATPGYTFPKPDESHEKKMKISLSQEQLKLKSESKNFLSVPKSTCKLRSASFSVDKACDESNSRETTVLIETKPLLNSTIPWVPSFNQRITVTPASKLDVNDDEDEIIYAVPSRQVNHERKIKIPSASLSTPLSSAQSSTADFNKNFKHPLSFYCKICSNILEDPRTLDCLHTFCIQCLARLDAAHDLQNNQFWRKISDSSCKCLWKS